MLKNKYHLPHNSVRIDEFNHMLKCIDLSKEFYLYEDLRLLFLKSQIADGSLRIFHKQYDTNLSNHDNSSIRRLYNTCKINPSEKKFAGVTGLPIY